MCYVVDDQGAVYPNGYFVPKANGSERSSRHAGELHATNVAPLFSVGLSARVLDKVTYTRSTGSKVVYERPQFPGSHL